MYERPIHPKSRYHTQYRGHVVLPLIANEHLHVITSSSDRHFFRAETPCFLVTITATDTGSGTYPTGHVTETMIDCKRVGLSIWSTLGRRIQKGDFDEAAACDNNAQYSTHADTWSGRVVIDMIPFTVQCRSGGYEFIFNERELEVDQFWIVQVDYSNRLFKASQPQAQPSASSKFISSIKDMRKGKAECVFGLDVL